MVKKIFALVMVMSILGGILAGCGEKTEEGAATAGTTTAGTAGTDAAGTEKAPE